MSEWKPFLASLLFAMLGGAVRGVSCPAGTFSWWIFLQRVLSASVAVDGEVVGAIRPAGQGLLAFVGVTHTDDTDTARRMADKLWRLRILDDERSAADVGAPILVVSQFTLYANTVKGRRPSWNAAAGLPVSARSAGSPSVNALTSAEPTMTPSA